MYVCMYVLLIYIKRVYLFLHITAHFQHSRKFFHVVILESTTVIRGKRKPDEEIKVFLCIYWYTHGGGGGGGGGGGDLLNLLNDVHNTKYHDVQEFHQFQILCTTTAMYLLTTVYRNSVKYTITTTKNFISLKCYCTAMYT